MAGIDLSDYIEVSERIVAFKKEHPEGSLQSEWEVVTVREQTFVVVVGYAYRSPDDARPGMGTAWEPFPGRTPYTKDSEVMVGESSAWGRAIAALGFEVKRGIASADEVRNRQPQSRKPNAEATDVQKKFLKDLMVKANLTGDWLKGKMAGDVPTREEAKALIAELKGE